MPIGLQIVFMDAGQGDATLVKFGDGSSILVDCGSKKNAEIVKEEIKEALATQVPMKQLRALVITHPDGDHYNLIKEIVLDADYRIGTLYYGGRLEDYTGVSGAIKTAVAHGQIATVAKLGRNVFDRAPRPELSGFDAEGNYAEVRIISANIGDLKNVLHRNLNSIVLFIRYLDINIFLMGDATFFSEEFIAASDQANGRWLDQMLSSGRTVLKVGHHGSLTSSTEEFVEWIKPQVAFISSDTKSFNGTSLPRSTVVDRLRSKGKIVDFSSSPKHGFVQYNHLSQRHEQIDTTLGIYTTLYKLDFGSSGTEFTAHGASLYYRVDTRGGVDIRSTAPPLTP